MKPLLKQIDEEGEKRAEQVQTLPRTTLIRIYQAFPVIPRHPATNIGE